MKRLICWLRGHKPRVMVLLWSELGGLPTHRDFVCPRCGDSQGPKKFEARR